MPTRIAIASSQLSDIQEAVHQSAVSVKEQLNSIQTDLVVFFASPAYAKPEALEIIHQILKPQRLVGSSTVGIILSEQICTRGVAILAINSDEMTFGVSCSLPLPEADLRTAGFEWARPMTLHFKAHQHHACLMFSDPRLHHSPKFIRGAQEVFGFGVPVLGGLGRSDPKSQKAVQFFQKQLISQSATGLLISGVNVAIGHQHGYKPLGKPRTITAVDQNVIQTIDNKPAVHIYEEYLNPKTGKLSAESLLSYCSFYPLGIYMEQYGRYLLKNAVDIRSDGSIVCQGEVPQGAEVHLMIGNRDSCRRSASDAAAQVKTALGGRQAKLIIIIESEARQKILKNSAFVEVQMIKEVLGYTTPIIGMYASGELVPPTLGHETNSMHVQNQSILIVAID